MAPRRRPASSAVSEPPPALYTAVLDDLGDAVLATDESERVIYANRAVETLLGWAPADARGRPLGEVLGFDLAAADLTRARGGEPVVLQRTLSRRGGPRFAAACTLSVPRDGGGAALGTTVVVADRSAAARAEADARESRLLLDLVAHEANCAAYAWSAKNDGVRVAAPRSWLDSHAEDLLPGASGNWMAHIVPEDLDAVQQALLRVTPETPTYEMTYRYRHRDGAVVTLRDRGRALFDAAGRIVGMRGTNVDITAEATARQAVAATEARLRTILDHAPLFVWMKDLDGRFLWVNRYFHRIHEGPETMIGRTLDEMLPPGVAAHPQGFEERVIASRQPLVVEAPFHLRDGSALDALVVLFPLLDADGQPYATCGFASDISDRIRSEAAQRTSEERFRALVEMSPTAVSILDAEGRTTYVSPNFTRMTGLDPKDALERPLAALVHPDDLEQAAARMRAVRAATGEPVPFGPLRSRHASRGWIWIEGSLRALFDTPGVRGLLVTFQDVSGRVEAEQALRASEHRFALALDAAGAGVWEYDVDSGTTHWSEQTFRLLGYAPGTVVPGREAWFAHIHPDDRAEAERRARAFTHHPGAVDHIFRVVWPDGSVHWLHALALADAGPIGDRHRLVGLYLDITDQKAVEEAVRTANDQLSARVAERTAELSRFVELVESSSDLIAMADHERGVITYDNRAMREATGREAVGMPLAEAIATLHSPDTVVTIRDQAIPTALREGRWEGPVTLQLADGRTVPASQLILAHADPDGRVRRTSTVVRDMSDRTAVEQALRERATALGAANAELARAARMKDDFLATMSHELRTPLNASLGMSEALREGVYGPLTAEQREALQIVTQSGLRLLALVNDILDVTRMDAGQLVLEYGPVSVESICRVALHRVDAAARAKNIRLGFAADAAAASVEADQRRLRQILAKLLDNAIKFTPPGGEVRLETHRVDDGAAIEFAVHDTGIGIDPADVERLFEPFVQLDSSLTRQYAGTGLGLNIVRRLVELHGGSISVESAPGRGSRFTVRLPAARTATAPSPPTPARGPEADAPLVLIAEDDEVTARLLADFLRARGFRTHRTRDGHETIAAAVAERPAAILMDVQMPGLDGLAATAAIRATAGIASVTIIALTALAMPSDRARCLAAGMDDYLAKPVSLVHLLEVLQRRIPAAGGGRAAP